MNDEQISGLPPVFYLAVGFLLAYLLLRPESERPKVVYALVTNPDGRFVNWGQQPLIQTDISIPGARERDE
jgi:hypothetical protein